MRIAFRCGGVAGMCTVGLGLLGAAVVVLIYKANAPEVLEGEPVYLSLLARAVKRRSVRVPSVRAVIRA